MEHGGGPFIFDKPILMEKISETLEAILAAPPLKGETAEEARAQAALAGKGEVLHRFGECQNVTAACALI